MAMVWFDMSSNFLIWKRQNKEMVIPISLATSLKPKRENDILICCQKPKKEKSMKQQYVCFNCGKIYNSIGLIKKRYNKKFDVVYDIDKKRDYLTIIGDKSVIVKSEINFTDALYNFGELLNDIEPLEVFSNENDFTKEAIKQIFEFLKENKICLFCEAFYRGDNFLCLIIPSATGKLLMLKLKDEQRIKLPYNKSYLDIEYTKSGFISSKKELEEEYLYLLSSGEEPKPIENNITLIQSIPQGFFSGD